MRHDWTDCLIVGGGVIGLAAARRMGLSGRDVIVIDKEAGTGTGVSSRSSEVIHSGLYNAPASHKARLCVAGRGLLYNYCREHAIDHARIGKLVVATQDNQLGALENIARNALECGVNDLVWLSQAEAQRIEPDLHCVAALLAPSSGLVDSHQLMAALQQDIESSGGLVVVNTAMVSAVPVKAGFIVRTIDQAGREFEFCAHSIINAGGLGAQNIANAISGLSHAHIPKLFYAKGSYFSLRPASPFSHLIYPIPVEGGLGVHLTLDLHGRARFGPDVEWLDHPNYGVDLLRAGQFYQSIRKYWPALRDGDLQCDYAGVRPKLSGPGAPAADFIIQGPQIHGLAGLVNLFGIESPGLTSCLAIAETIARLFEESS